MYYEAKRKLSPNSLNRSCRQCLLKNLQNDLELLYKDGESPDKYSLFLGLIQHLTCCRVLRNFSHN
jgi:hypothetical protein